MNQNLQEFESFFMSQNQRAYQLRHSYGIPTFPTPILFIFPAVFPVMLPGPGAIPQPEPRLREQLHTVQRVWRTSPQRTWRGTSASPTASAPSGTQFNKHFRLPNARNTAGLSFVINFLG